MIVEQKVKELLRKYENHSTFTIVEAAVMMWLYEEYGYKENILNKIKDGLFSLNMIDYQNSMDRDCIFILTKFKTLFEGLRVL